MSQVALMSQAHKLRLQVAQCKAAGDGTLLLW